LMVEFLTPDEPLVEVEVELSEEEGEEEETAEVSTTAEWEPVEVVD
jgi:hypothetical protein